MSRSFLSVLNQSYRNEEYIIIDGKSTDGTQEVIEKYKDKLAYYVSEPDGGIYDAMNKGIKQATGDVIGIINSDDWYELDAVANIVPCFESSDAEIVHGKIKYIHLNGSVSYSPNMSLNEMWMHMSVSHPSCFVKREVYQRKGLFDTKYRIAGDYEFMLRCYSSGVKFKYIDKVIANFRYGGISTTDTVAVERETLQIAKAYMDKCFDWDRKTLLELWEAYMLKAYIWGTGENRKKVMDTVNREKCEIVGFIDNNPNRQGKEIEGMRIYSVADVVKKAECIIISVFKFDAILYQLEKLGYNMSNVVVFWSDSFDADAEYADIFYGDKRRILLLEQKVEQLERKLDIKTENIGYEIADGINKGLYKFPILGDTEKAIYKIAYEGCSLIRFGDGEFEIMAGNERPRFQKYNQKLAERMREAITSKEDKLLIAIADNYGNLDKYVDEIADGIRGYMGNGIRERHMSILDKDREYFDAYMFRTYVLYRNKNVAYKRVQLVKKIWDDRNVVLIEGEKTRTGYGNDLFDNVKSLKRILAPTENAWDKYDEVLKVSKDKINIESIVLIALGPAGKVLAYDLFRTGQQVVDIGQIDIDYEWQLAGAGVRVPVSHKYVSELPPAEILDINDDEYNSQIVCHVR